MLKYKDFQTLLLLENEEDILNFVKTFGQQDLDAPPIDEPEIATRLEPQGPSPPRLSAAKDNSANKLNKIVRPQGMIFQDTWNNFIFPIQPLPKIDTSRFDIAEVFKRFREKYLLFPSMYLPWHYMVEMIGNRYYIFQTRPLDMKFPLTNQEVIDSLHDFRDETTKKFFENKTFQIDNMIHICLVGDSNLDIYPEKLYRLIGTTCVAPMFRDMRIPGSVDSRVFPFNLGPKFRLNTVVKFGQK